MAHRAAPTFTLSSPRPGPAGLAATARGADVSYVDCIKGRGDGPRHDRLIRVTMDKKLMPILFPSEADDSLYHINFY